MSFLSWLFQRKKDSTPQSSTTNLLNISNNLTAKHVLEITIKGTNLSPDTQKTINEKIAHSVSKGESPRHCKAIYDFPADFEWKEYSYWNEKFKKMGTWPANWEAGKEYLYIDYLQSKAIFKERLDDFKDNDVKSVEIIEDEKSCPVCKKIQGKEILLKNLTKDNTPPLHPGCMCVIVAIDFF